MSETWETPCPNSADGKHHPAWYDAEACPWCGAPACPACKGEGPCTEDATCPCSDPRDHDEQNAMQEFRRACGDDD